MFIVLKYGANTDSMQGTIQLELNLSINIASKLSP